MSTKLPASNPLAYVGLKETNPPQLYFRNRAPTAADARPYDKGDIWIDEVALEGYILGLRIGAVASWIPMTTVGANETLTGDVGGTVFPDGLDNINIFGAGGLTVTGVPAANTLTIAPSGGGSLVESLTGDAGGAVGPDGTGDIDILGNSGAYLNGIQFTGAPGANTITAMDLRNITVYVVDAVAGQTEYQTVQAAVDAANADGGGTVYVRPGIYVEDLVLYDAVDIIAAVATPAGFETTITGIHTPPAAGAVSLRNLSLTSATDILSSAVAGTTTIVIIDCITDCATGYTFNLANWTGLIAFINSHSVGTQDGLADIGAGGADFLGLNSTLGIGTAQLGALGGNVRINNCNINCQMDWVGNAAGIIRASQVTQTWLVSDNAACVMTDTLFINAASETFLNHTSTGNVTLSNVTISTDQDPDVITGTGTVIFGSVIFTNNSDINVAITKQSVGNVETGPIHIGSGVTDPTNHIEIIEEVIADDVTILAVNTDNTDPASDTIVNLLTGGASAGDPFLHLEVTAVTEYSLGIDNSVAGDPLKLTDGATPSAGTEYMLLDIPASRWEFPINVFQQEIANIGGGVQNIVSNTDNTNAASDAFFSAMSGGASGGDPFLHLEVDSVAERSFGIDNSDSDNLKITTGASPSAATTQWQMTTDGERTIPLQPYFQASITTTEANETGDGTVYNANAVAYTENHDIGGNFNAATGVFTCPVTGIYLFTAAFSMGGLAAGHTTCELTIVSSADDSFVLNANAANMRTAANTLLVRHTGILSLAAGVTVYLQFTVTGAAKTVDILQDTTVFQGILLS